MENEYPKFRRINCASPDCSGNDFDVDGDYKTKEVRLTCTKCRSEYFLHIEHTITNYTKDLIIKKKSKKK